VQFNLFGTDIDQLLPNLFQLPGTPYTVVVETTEQDLIAPCGMNCGVCEQYLAKAHNLRDKGFHVQYCPGCLPSGECCPVMGKQCERLGKGLVRFCYECRDYPCRSLKALDKRCRSRFQISQIENLEFIKTYGIASFAEKEATRWRCPECGGVVSCHNGLCFVCDLDKLRRNRRCRRGEQ
jgi:hypothetical protein